jgi:hypothetical protein
VPDPQFIDDLVAAKRLKGFLLGRGTALDSRTLIGLNDLMTAFAEDVAQHEKAWGLNRPPPAQARGGGWWRRGEP